MKLSLIAELDNPMSLADLEAKRDSMWMDDYSDEEYEQYERNLLNKWKQEDEQPAYTVKKLDGPPTEPQVSQRVQEAITNGFHEPSDEELPLLADLTAAYLIDVADVANNWAFVIARTDAGDKVFMDDIPMGFHDGLEQRLYSQGVDLSDVLYGRMATDMLYTGGLWPKEIHLYVPHIVAVTALKPESIARAQAAIEQMTQDGKLSPGTIAVVNKNVWRVGGAATSDFDAEAAEQERLYRMLHTGKDEYGQPLTPQTRLDVRRKLGLVTGGKQNPWQLAMLQKGLARPGQKLWAMHSESR